MGKYNRASTSRKLNKLTTEMAKEQTKPVTPKLAKKIENIAEEMKKDPPIKIEHAKGKPLGRLTKKQIKQIMPKPTEQPHPGTHMRVQAEVKPAELPKNSTDINVFVGEDLEKYKKMNIYQKLQAARKIISQLEIKKSGANDDKGFNYFELADYMPMVTSIGEQIGFMTHFSMTNELGTLKVINTDDPKDLTDFSIPTAELTIEGAEGKAAEGIQILGGKTTYLRRYLMQIAFEISVKDTVDNRGNKPLKPQDDLDARDIEAIDSASDLESLGAIVQNIRGRKDFKKNIALLKHYTAKKDQLEK